MLGLKLNHVSKRGHCCYDGSEQYSILNDGNNILSMIDEEIGCVWTEMEFCSSIDIFGLHDDIIKWKQFPAFKMSMLSHFLHIPQNF